MSDMLDECYPLLSKRGGRLRFMWGYKHGWKWVPRFLQQPLVDWYNRVACSIGEHDLTLVEQARKGLLNVEESECVDCPKRFPLSEADD